VIVVFSFSDKNVLFKALSLTHLTSVTVDCIALNY